MLDIHLSLNAEKEVIPTIKAEFWKTRPCEGQLAVSRTLAMPNEGYGPGNRQKDLPNRGNSGQDMEVRKGIYWKTQIFEEKEHQITRHKAGAENQEVTQRTEHTSLYERSDLRYLYQLTWINWHEVKMLPPPYALLVIFGRGGQGAGDDIHIWMYIYTYTYIFMAGPLCCTEQTVSGHFSIFKNTFWQFKWITPSHFHFGLTTTFLFLILYVSPWRCAKQSPGACQSKLPHRGALQTPEGSLWRTLGGSKFQKQEFTLGAGTQEGILLY